MILTFTKSIFQKLLSCLHAYAQVCFYLYVNVCKKMNNLKFKYMYLEDLIYPIFILYITKWLDNFKDN